MPLNLERILSGIEHLTNFYAQVPIDRLGDHFVTGFHTIEMDFGRQVIKPSSSTRADGCCILIKKVTYALTKCL